jgi:hypothetical protein
MLGKFFALGTLVLIISVVSLAVITHQAPGWRNASCNKIPEFSDFPTEKIFTGFRPSISGPAFDLSDWKKELTAATTSAINYASDYVVKTKPCQKSGCVQHLMLNAKTGYVINIGLYAKKEAEFRPDSSLFVVETTATTSAQRTFYKITDNKMELVCVEK